MTNTERLLAEARDIARRILGEDVSSEVVGQIFDSLVMEHRPDAGEHLEDEGRTVH